MIKNRVLYLPLPHFQQSPYYKRLNDILNNFKNPSAQNINDYLELYSISKYLRDDSCKKFLSNQNFEKKDEFKKVILTYLSEFPKSINEESLKDMFSYLEKIYYSVFLDFSFEYIFEKEKKYTDFFKNYIFQEIGANHILSNKKISEIFSEEIRLLMLDNPYTAENIISSIELDDKIFIPKNLSDNDKNTIIHNYVLSENYNLNYLTLLRYSRKLLKGDFGNKMRLLIENKISTIMSSTELIKDDHQNKIEYNIIFSCEYSRKWLEKYFDYPTILNNFIYIFNFVDENNRISLTRNEKSIFHNLFITPKNNYLNFLNYKGFNIINSVAQIHLLKYSEILTTKNIHILNVIKWYFSEYIPQNYGINEFLFDVPSSETTFKEKCILLLPQLEIILKQYNLLSKDKSINHQLLTDFASKLNMREIRSLSNKRYIELAKEDSTYFKLFKKYGELPIFTINETTIYDAVLNGLYYSTLEDYDKQSIDVFCEKKYLKIDNGKVMFDNPSKISIMLDIYKNGFISLHDKDESFLQTCEELKKEKEIKFIDTLFSTKELDYFSYFLNDQTFSDSLSIRNRYLHNGTFSFNTCDKEHERYYYIIVELLILTTIKIETDLKISDFCKKN